jgi:hypothetical protein
MNRWTKDAICSIVTVTIELSNEIKASYIKKNKQMK